MFQCDINVTSGIRQGCNASSNLFLLITYCIIEKLYDYDNLSGVNTNICKIVALFFADDGMILMQSLRERKESIQVLMNIAEECGMNINKDKSNIIIFNHKEKIHEDNIEGIQITDTINYLGVTIQNKRDCFNLYHIIVLDLVHLL